MASTNPLHWWRSFLKLPNAHPLKAVGIVFLVALSCSFVVSLTAVTLKPMQDENRLREANSSLAEVMDILGGGAPATRFVVLSSGDYTRRDSSTRIDLAPDRDIAGLVTLETVATVYELREGGELKFVVLPVHGYGYQSLLRGYLALGSDLNTVAALSFHEQGETPGMGARIGEREWLALWGGRRVADEDGVIRLAVARGEATGVHEVDGISGATRTGSGVTNLVQFWLGPDGYGPYLQRLRVEGQR